MLDLKELLKQGEALVTELEALRGKAESAETDEAKTATAAAIAEKDAEWEKLQGKVAEAKAHAAKMQVLAEVRALGQSVIPASGPSLVTPDTVPAQAIDRVAEERAKSEAIWSYILNEPVPEQLQAMLKPKPSDKNPGAGGVKLTRTVFGQIFGKDIELAIYGKTNPLTSAGTGQGEASLVPQDYRAQMWQLPGEPTYIMQLATVVPGSTGTLTYPRLVQSDGSEYGGVVCTWIAEGGAKPETQPEFEQVEIVAHELAAHTQITLRLLARSAINLEAYLASLFRGSIMNTVDLAFLTGTGVGQPLGLVADATVRACPRVAAGAVSYQDLVNVKHRLMSFHRGNARWFIDDTVEAVLEGTLDTTNRPLFNASVAAGPYDRLTGYPYIVTERQPNIGTAGDVIFGDWRQYVINLEADVVIKRSDHYEFLNNVATFVVYMVIGGRAALGRAFCYLDDAAS